MTLARDLLEQATYLSQREKTRPKQASLRRAVSAAYYAVFHLLNSEAVDILEEGVPEPVSDDFDPGSDDGHLNGDLPGEKNADDDWQGWGEAVPSVPDTEPPVTD